MAQQQPLYDVFFTGKLVAGISSEQAQIAVASLFKTRIDKIAPIFDGKSHALKRNLSKQDALKYKAALHQAGLSILFKLSATDKATAQPKTAASVKKTGYQIPKVPASAAANFSVAPVGSEVLAPHERKSTAVTNIDTSHIKLSTAFTGNINKQQPIPHPPNTSHLSIAEVGAELLAAAGEAAQPLPLDLTGYSLAPIGEPLEQLQTHRPPLNPDISAISLAPAGADLLACKKVSIKPNPPDISHLSVARLE